MKLAEKVGAGVLESSPAYMNFPTNHWAHLGSSQGGAYPDSPVPASDCILILDADVPWMPHYTKAQEGARLFMVDLDPIKEGMPMHYFGCSTFRVDSNVALSQMLKSPHQAVNLESKIAALKSQHGKRLASLAEQEKPSAKVTCQYLGACLREAFEESSTIILNEGTTNLKLVNDHLNRTLPNSLYNNPAASLGWSGGAAIAAKLAYPSKTVIQVVGDGSYLFTVPSTVHWMARRYDTPFLTIVLNNRGWRAPQASTFALYPKGIASQVTADDIHCSIDPPPDYAGIAAAAGGAFGIKVDKCSDIVPALKKAKEVLATGRGVLIDLWLQKF